MKRLSSEFTLLELLIVVSIIGILASLLLPSLVRAREMVRATDCRSHLRQFGLACAQYSCDYGGALICYYTPSGESSPTITWSGTVGLYLGMGNTKEEIDKTFTSKNTLYTCASHRWREGSNPAVKGQWGRGYGINSHFSSGDSAVRPWSSPDTSYAKSAMVINPSKLMYFSEIDCNTHVPTYSGKVYSLSSYADGGYYIEQSWHLGYHNLLYFDGHVGKYKWGTMPGENTEEGAELWCLKGIMNTR